MKIKFLMILLILIVTSSSIAMATEGDVLWEKTDLGELISPVIDKDGYIYAHDDNTKVYKLDPSDGSVAGTYTLAGGDIDRQITLSNDDTAIYCWNYDDGKIYAINTADMTEKWISADEMWVADGVVVDVNGYIYVGRDIWNAESVCRLDPIDGSIDWNYQHDISDRPSQFAITADGNKIATLIADYMLVLNTDDGSVVYEGYTTVEDSQWLDSIYIDGSNRIIIQNEVSGGTETKDIIRYSLSLNEEIDSFNNAGHITSCEAGMIIDDGKYIVPWSTTYDGDGVAVLTLNNNFQEVSTVTWEEVLGASWNTFSGYMHGQPVLADNDYAYFMVVDSDASANPDKYGVFCADVSEGTVIWWDELSLPTHSIDKYVFAMDENILVTKTMTGLKAYEITGKPKYSRANFYNGDIAFGNHIISNSMGGAGITFDYTITQDGTKALEGTFVSMSNGDDSGFTNATGFLQVSPSKNTDPEYYITEIQGDFSKGIKCEYTISEEIDANNIIVYGLKTNIQYKLFNNGKLRKTFTPTSSTYEFLMNDIDEDELTQTFEFRTVSIGGGSSGGDSIDSDNSDSTDGSDSDSSKTTDMIISEDDFSIDDILFDNTLIESLEIPNEYETLDFETLKDSYLIDLDFEDRMNLIIESLTKISTWLFILGAYVGAFCILWYFGRATIENVLITGTIGWLLPLIAILIGLNPFELNIWLKTTNYFVALLNFIISGKFFAFIYVKLFDEE